VLAAEVDEGCILSTLHIDMYIKINSPYCEIPMQAFSMHVLQKEGNDDKSS
jgi:hypothetical protein